MNNKESICGNYLVTGGAGFVGSAIVKRLLEEGAKVTVLDDFFTGKEDNLPTHNNLKVIRGSVADYDTVLSASSDADIIIHTAARNIIVSTKDPREDFESNIGGTLNVLLAARAHSVRRVVYTSSVSIFGNPRYLPINEDDPTTMLSPYAVSKFGGENYCQAFYENFGLSTAVVRYSNVYGPGQRPDNPYCGVVAKFFDAAMKGKPLKIHGDGEQTRDITYIDDTVTATLKAAVSPKAEGEIYNIGTGREVSINLLANMIIESTGSRSKVEHVDRRDIDNIRRRVVNIEKARRELRWLPEVNLATGLANTYKWLVENGHV